MAKDIDTLGAKDGDMWHCFLTDESVIDLILPSHEQEASLATHDQYKNTGTEKILKRFRYFGACHVEVCMMNPWPFLGTSRNQPPLHHPGYFETHGP